jgi:hypothetical protein
MKHTYPEIQEIVDSLETFVNSNASIEWYAMAKNIRIGKKLLKQRDELLQDLRKKCCVVDSRGNAKYFTYDKQDNFVEFDDAKISEYKRDRTGNVTLRVKFLNDEMKELFNENSDQINKDKQDVKWHSIPIGRLKNEEGDMIKISGNYAPLVDVIFVEPVESQPDEEKKAEPKKSK